MPSKIPLEEFDPQWMATTFRELARLRSLDGPAFVSPLSWDIAQKAKDRLLLMAGGDDVRFHLVNMAILVAAEFDPYDCEKAPTADRLLAIASSADELAVVNGDSDPVRAHGKPLFPQGTDGIPQDDIDLIVRLDSERSMKSDAEIAREFFESFSDPTSEARKALARIRALRQRGRTSLPART